MNDYQKIEGLENYTESTSAVLWIKVLNSSAATAAKKPAGTVVVGRDNEVLAEPEKPFNFIPVYFFTDWSIWSERVKGGPAPKLLKRTFDGKVWSDGSKVMDHEVNWIGTTPPLATETCNFVVIPQSEIKRDLAEGEERRSMILAIQLTNKERRKAARELKTLIATKAVEQKVSGIYQMAFSLTTQMFSNDAGDVWYDFVNPTFLKLVNESTTLIGKAAYTKVRALNKSTLALEAGDAQPVAQIEAPKKAEVVDAVPPPAVVPVQAIVDLNADF